MEGSKTLFCSSKSPLARETIIIIIIICKFTDNWTRALKTFRQPWRMQTPVIF
jgi:hypothetical protein